MPEMPRTHIEAVSLLFQAGLARAYEKLATAAWKGRLTNADIARIESDVIAMLGEANEAADEFPAFELEKSVAEARRGLRLIFNGAKNARDQPR